MSADIYVGLQYGSEGKGKVCAALAQRYAGSVRTGAPNAGHTVIHEGKAYKMRSVPCGWVEPTQRLFIGAGGLINPEVLAKELAALPDDVVDRLRIDFNAGVINEMDIKAEEHARFNDFNGSTSEGVGMAQARKVLRKEGTIAGHDKHLQRFIGDVSREVNNMLNKGLDVQLEGTQGFGLSLNHGQYPYVTSRDIIASSLLADAGISPRLCGKIIGVMRTYPIRVAGNSGPMGAQETDWVTVAQRCGAPDGAIQERTTVTNRIRRVSELDWDLLRRAVLINRPTGVIITFADYLDWNLHSLTHEQYFVTAMRNLAMTRAQDALENFVEMTERALNVPVLGLSTGPESKHMIWTRTGQQLFDLDERTAAVR